ncbi:MAG: ABC transporter permease [Clostridium sp.]|nr:ABC transporter permease [Clostridium sp.]
MLSVMKNISRILLRRKSFVITTFVVPIVIIFAYTAIVLGHKDIKVALINNDNKEFGKVVEEKLNNIDGVTVIELDKDDNFAEDLIFHKYEMVLTIDKNFTENILDRQKPEVTYKSMGMSDSQAIIKNILDNEITSLVNICNNLDVKTIGIGDVIETYNNSKPSYERINETERKVNITQCMGLIFYIIFTSTSFSTAFLLEDEQAGTRDRILMGKLSEKSYYLAYSLVFLIFSLVPSLEYFAMNILLKYDFGFENKALFLIPCVLISIFSVVFGVFISSIVKNKNVYSTIAGALSVPMFMLSGSFWDFEFMSSSLQSIGNALPPRWIFMIIEKLQNGESIINTLPMIGGIILFSLVLFLLSAFFTKNKIELVKSNM